MKATLAALVLAALSATALAQTSPVGLWLSLIHI